MSVVERGCLSLQSAGAGMHSHRWLWCLGFVAPFTWGLPGPGSEPVSPALAGGFPTTETPGKSLTEFFKKAFLTQAVEKAMAPHSSVFLPGKSHGWSPMDGGAWWAAVRGVTKSRARLSDFTFTFHFHALEKEMATHSSVLAWRIPGTGSLVGGRLWGRSELDTTEAT